MSKGKRHKRGYSSRKVDIREIRQRFLIVCEGEKTEPNYFKSFRVSKDVCEIDILGFGENPSRLIERLKELKAQDEYDQAWCVFDRDDLPTDDFNNAIHSAQANGFRVAYSNQAFELWYILHFEFLTTGITRKDYCQKLTVLLGQTYQKNSEEIYDLLFPKQALAIKYAAKLLADYDPSNPASNNPSTTVHELVQELNRFVQP